MTCFPNKAGDHTDTDSILLAELKAAGIPSLWEAEEVKDSTSLRKMIREQSGEVKTSELGVLHGWKFTRNWYYWSAEGPGIDVETAEALHAVHGKEVRVAGHGSCLSPREWYKGLACGFYHVDTPEGLLALANCIKSLVEKSMALDKN